MKLHRIYLASFANGLWFSVAHAQDAEAYLRPIGERGVGGGLPTWVAILVLAVVGLGLLNSFGARGFTHMILVVVAFYGGWGVLELQVELPSILAMIGGAFISWGVAKASNKILRPFADTKEHKNHIRRLEAAEIRKRKLEALD